MPLTLLHAGAGAAAAATHYTLDCALADKSLNPGDLSRLALLGAVAGALPDILEPPTNRYHRKFFHSVTVLGAVVYFLANLEDLTGFTGKDITTARSLLIAYLSHLLLDSRTPMSLPLFF